MATKKKLGSGRHASAIKRHRQSVKVNVQNKAQLSTMRTAIKKLNDALSGTDKKVAQDLFIKAQSIIDRAIRKGLVHARAGQRKIARLNTRLDSLS